jgi:hypothetical protein
MLETDDGIQLSGFHLRDVIGRSIVCDDGITRRVEQISHSFRFADKVLINEMDEDDEKGGSWVHALSLSCQMCGKPVPTKDQKEAFSRTMGAFRFQPERDAHAPQFIKLPSGLLISPR